MILTDLLVIAIALLFLLLTALCLALVLGERLKEERRAKVVFWSTVSVVLLLEAAWFCSYFAGA